MKSRSESTRVLSLPIHLNSVAIAPRKRDFAKKLSNTGSLSPYIRAKSHGWISANCTAHEHAELLSINSHKQLHGRATVRLLHENGDGSQQSLYSWPDPCSIQLPSSPLSFYYFYASPKALGFETVHWPQLTIALAPASAAQATQLAEVRSQLEYTDVEFPASIVLARAKS